MVPKVPVHNLIKSRSQEVPVLKLVYLKHIYLYKCIDMVPKVPVHNLIKARSRDFSILKVVFWKQIYLYKCIDMVPKGSST